jgi:hypothetical protein
MKTAKPRPRPREFVQEQTMDEILAAIEADRKADGKGKR